MANIEAYEANLDVRLEELRKQDQAYVLHSMVVAEAIIYSAQMHGEDPGSQHLLDCGCGLGFMTNWLAGYFQNTVGIDPSQKAISMAQNEHPEVNFHVSSAETFADRMPDLEIQPFDQAVLNMVLHATDDSTTIDILKGVGRCLKPEGTLILIVPTQTWILSKLHEYAQDSGMGEDESIKWAEANLAQKEVELPIKTSGNTYWPKPIIVQNRSERDYADFLIRSGFGFPWVSHDQETGKEISRVHLPYMDMNDYFSSNTLYARHRTLLMSFYFQLDPKLFAKYYEFSGKQ